ncbi:hypothetical protein BGZ65_006931 [Modicella reniformis]|uniref:Uncharacterized protein n=1 Tax=Modicella reniformis TaxID=1440133 RepID=A0A9P6LS34_9FUNG|nr:hypothetical protein BGZ65_006931 [Modicella reniformis]
MAFIAPGALAVDPNVEGPVGGSDQGPVYSNDHYISGGAIAGIVIGLLAATGLAGALGCYLYAAGPDSRGVGGVGVGGHPTRTVATEKMEPVVVRAGQLPGTSAGATTVPATGHNTTGSSTHLPPMTTTTATPPGSAAYSAQPRDGVMDGVHHA